MTCQFFQGFSWVIILFYYTNFIDKATYNILISNPTFNNLSQFLPKISLLPILIHSFNKNMK